jgi:hypothetical protein
MTELLQRAMAYAQTLELADQDHIARTILADPPLALIRARLSEADADLEAGRIATDAHAFWAARLEPLQEPIVF